MSTWRTLHWRTPSPLSYERYRARRRDYESLQAAAANRDSRMDLLRYQLTELNAEVTTAAAIEDLFVDQKRIAGRGRLAAAARTALNAAYEADGGSAHDLLGKAHAALRALGDADPQLAGPGALLAEALINTREAAEALRRYLDVLDIDPARQDEIERHAAALEALARKHRIGVSELPRAAVAHGKASLPRSRMHRPALAALELELAGLSRDYRTAASRLTAARTSAAEHLGQRITELMQALGMAGGRFAVAVAPSSQEFGPHGER